MTSISSRLRKDTARLFQEPPPDVLAPESGLVDLTTLSVYLQGPDSTPFQNAWFKVTLKCPPEYPLQPPKVFFNNKIFHPNVDPRTGEVCVDTLKRDWSSDVDLNRILLTIRCLLIQPNPDSSLNEEAGKLIQEDYSQFESTARMMTKVHGLSRKDVGASSPSDPTAAEEPEVLQPIGNQPKPKKKKTGLKRL